MDVTVAARRDVPGSAKEPPVADCEPGTWAQANAAHISRRPASWLDPRTLWAARNQVVSWIADPVDAVRAHWVDVARDREREAGRSPDFVVDRSDSAGAVLILGDPGEGDLSQYAVVPALEAATDGVDLGVVCSDVIYPAGSAAEYPDKFTWPYRNLAFPLWAAPGNHDWYDGLRGFLANFCDLHAEGPGRASFPPGPRGWLAWRWWRRDPPLTTEELARMRALPDETRAARRPQPAPYFALDTSYVRYVVIDTGIDGRIDQQQRRWLWRVSLGDPRPKVLLTGKPLYVNGKADDRTSDVDAVVRDPGTRFVAAIGGDTHNYQRYRIDVGGRTITYIVSGGGGAFMHDTHSIPKVDLPGTPEEEFRLFPLRRDSLTRYSQVIDRKLGAGLGLLRVDPEDAGRYFVQHHGINPLPADVDTDMTKPLGMRPRLAAAVLSRLYAGPWFHRLLGPVVFDWDRPRVFKQFLRLEPSAETLVVRCLSASGCAWFEHQVAEEDRVEIPLR